MSVEKKLQSPYICNLYLYKNMDSALECEYGYRSYITKRYTLYNTHYTLHITQNQGTLARCPDF